MKKISLLLSTILFISSFFSSFLILPVNTYAASEDQIDYNLFFQQRLTEGTNSPIPETDNFNSDNSEIMISVPASSLYSGENFNNGTYTLSYNSDIGEEVIFTIEKTSADTATVTYSIVDPDTGVSKDNLDQVRIYATNSTAQKYVDYDTYIDEGYNSSGDYSVVDTRPTGVPTFNIVPDTGYSVQYSNTTFHFLWDDTNDTFNFDTNGIEKGNIYEMDLNLKVGTVDYTADLNVSTGLNTATFTSEPFANSDTDNLQNNLPSEDGLLFVDDVLQQIDGETPYDDNPGSDEVGIKMSFVLPKVWTDSASGFTTPISSSNFDDSNLDMRISMEANTTGNEAEENRVQIDINDILDASSSRAVNVNSSTATLAASSFDDTNGEATIYLTDMNHSIIFSNVSFSFNQPDESVDDKLISFDTSSIGQNESDDPVYTFPAYQVVNMGNQLYIDLEPFVGYSGTYVLLVSDTPSAKKTYSGSGSVTFPLEISTTNQGTEIYQIIFSTSDIILSDIDPDEYIQSQKLQVKAGEDTGVIVTPSNFEVTNYDLAGKEGSDIEKDLTIDMQWDIGYKNNLDTYLNTLAVGETVTYVYGLNSRFSPEDDEAEQVAQIMIDVYKDATGTVYAKYYGGDGGIDYNSVNDTYDDMEDYTYNYVLEHGLEFELKSEYRADQDAELYVADVSMRFRAVDEDSADIVDDPTEVEFYYPNIYFLTIDPLIFEGNVDILGESDFQSITLDDDSDASVPPPQDVTITDVTTEFIDESTDTNPITEDQVSFTIDWLVNGDSIQEYLSSIYNRDTLSNFTNSTGGEFFYNIYISENKDEMQNYFSEYPYNTEPYNTEDKEGTRLGESETLDYDKASYESGEDPDSVYDQIYVSDINGMTPSEVNNSPAIDSLRDSDVVRIDRLQLTNEEIDNIAKAGSDLSKSITIDGLDTNTQYFVYIDAVYIDDDYYQEASDTDDSDDAKVDYSLLSPAQTFTTGDHELEPDESDKIPSMPEIELIENGTDYAVLGWDPILMYNEDGTANVMEYEIIRTETNQMPDDYLNLREPYDQEWDNFSEVTDLKIGYRLNADGTVSSYNGSEFETTTEAEYYIADDGSIVFTDNALVPNTIYFYYVRTVRNFDDDEESYSSWNNLSVTTYNIDKPINLKVLQSSPFFEYDPENEVIINFDAPIINLDLLGTDVDIAYSIKTGSNDWSNDKIMDADTLIDTATNVDGDGYRNFTYKISDLEPGTSYSIRVRLIDADNQKSLYSNIATTRTDLDQDDYDDNDEVDDWTDRLIELLMEILDEPYWLLNDGGSDYDVVYRESKFEGYSNSQGTDSFTLLPAKENQANDYYIPANSFEFLNNSNKGITIVYDNMEFNMPANAITSANDAYIAMEDDLDVKDSLDYYYKITVTGSDINTINSIDTVSDQVSFRVSLVGFDKYTMDWEIQMYNYLLEMVETDDDLMDFLDDLSDAVLDDESSEELQDLLLDIVDDMSDEFYDEIEDSFEDTLSGSGNNHSVTNLEKNLAISLIGNVGGSVNGYELENSNWVLLNTIGTGTIATMLSNAPGIFAFAAEVIDLGNANVSDPIKDLFINYDLDDFFGSGNTFNGSGQLTNSMVLGATARMMGAEVGEDAVTYLKSLGLSASSRNANSQIDADDVVYYLMALYEHKANIDLSTYAISNYNSTRNMTNISSNNLKSVQVASEIGLITNPAFNGNSAYNIDDFLTLLDRLNKKVQL